MSHIGKKSIVIPNDVFVTFKNDKIIIKGKYGILQTKILNNIKLNLENNTINLVFNKDVTTKFHGLMRTLIANMIKGVNEKFYKILIMEGIGYKFQLEKNYLITYVGFTYINKFFIPFNIKVILNSNTKISLSSINKEKLGLFASKIRAVRAPEPYKGKGILYEGEIIKRKVGKKGK